MPEFNTPVDIGNRALQHCGAEMMDAVLGFTEVSKVARQISFVYGKLRRAELERNVWTFATRRAALRAVDTNTMLLVPTLWVSTTSYFVGSIVNDGSGTNWISRVPNNLGNQPQNSATWEPYFGPLTVTLYDSSKVYFSGELVYTMAGDGTYNVYLSLISGNAVDPSLPNQWNSTTVYFQNQVVQAFPAWAVGTTYSQGQTVSYTDGNIYCSLTNGNVGNIPPSSAVNWALVPTLVLTSQAVPTTTVNRPPTSSPVIEWAVANTYALGNFVMFNGTEYVSIAANNTGNYPNAAGSTFWKAVSLGTLYMSLINFNINNNPANAPALWAVGTTYATGNKVGGSDGLIYSSVGNGNIGNNPTTDGGVNWTNTGVLNPWTTVFTQGGGNDQWLQIGGASFPSGVGLSPTLNTPYPLGSGPSSQSTTSNIYRLPSGFLRDAPQDPKAGAVSGLGFPGNSIYNDWVVENGYIVTRDVGVIVYRFVADIQDVSTMKSMFCEGLAARIGLEVCEPLTNSTAKLGAIGQAYNKVMGEARLENAIEAGSEDQPLDDFISCRA